MRRLIMPVSLLAALAIAACGGDDSDDGEEAAAAPETACEQVERPAPKEVKLKRPPAKPSADELTAIVETSCGTFEITLSTDENPKTAASFAYLAEEGAYDDTAWHRVATAPPVIQGGDPLGDGTGGPGYSVDEAPPSDTAYTRGIVAMAKTEVEPPGRSGSQFFIVTAADAGLPPIYAVAGEVTEGFEVVEEIAALADPASPTQEPSEPAVIRSVTIEEG